jgi:hypothetical protein
VEVAQIGVGGVRPGQADDELPSHHRFEAHALLRPGGRVLIYTGSSSI